MREKEKQTNKEGEKKKERERANSHISQTLFNNGIKENN